MENNTNAPYASLCQLADTTPFDTALDIDSFDDINAFEKKGFNERLTSALSVLLSLAVEDDESIDKVDKILIDKLINRLDEIISLQMNEIIHDDAFQALESLWRSLYFLVDKSVSNANMAIELIDVDKTSLKEDFNDSVDIFQSGLYQHVYVSEYDTAGGEPFTAMISPYEFDARPEDINLLSDISKVASSSHCPFIGNVGGAFFNKENISEITHIDDLHTYMERAEYIKWNGFRETEEARYVGLTLPKFVIRLPYDGTQRHKGFQYHEKIGDTRGKEYVWGSASFAFAANLCRSFKSHGWCVNIVGTESGGKVEGLLVPQYDLGCGSQSKIPTECLFSESKELGLAEEGFIPLTYYKNSDYACFFSANSTQKALRYDDHETDANSRINSRLPYIFLSSRLAHYLKVIQRENIGAKKSRKELETSLNQWLKGLITRMNHPSPEVLATHPLKDGIIEVKAIKGKPGFYRVNLAIMPHFQIEGIDVRLSLCSELPGIESEN